MERSLVAPVVDQAGGVIRLCLWLVALAVAAALWRWADFKVIAALSLSSLQLCALSVAAVWSLREKAEDNLVAPSADEAEELERASDLVHEVLHPIFLRRAVITALMTVLVGFPAASAFAGKVIWESTAYLAAVGAAECAYSFIVATRWNAQIRAFRAVRAIEDARRRERAAIMNAVTPLAESKPAANDWGPSIQPIAK